jgi:aspartyl-tRNA(Asn)/glutamyl-tRNA(Gln) amidotransferase subunit A
VVRIPGVRGEAVMGTAADLVRAERVRGEAQRTLARVFERHDLLLSPAPQGIADATGAPSRDWLSSALALGGLPALSLPIGLAGTRPLGARLVAPPLDEARLLSAGALFQSRSSHHLQRPPIGAAAIPVAAVTRR